MALTYVLSTVFYLAALVAVYFFTYACYWGYEGNVRDGVWAMKRGAVATAIMLIALWFSRSPL